MKWLIVGILLGLSLMAVWYFRDTLMPPLEVVQREVEEHLADKAVKDEAIKSLSTEIARLSKEADAAKARARTAEAAAALERQRSAALVEQVGRLEAERKARPVIASIREGRDELAARLAR